MNVEIRVSRTRIAWGPTKDSAPNGTLYRYFEEAAKEMGSLRFQPPDGKPRTLTFKYPDVLTGHATDGPAGAPPNSGPPSAPPPQQAPRPKGYVMQGGTIVGFGSVEPNHAMSAELSELTSLKECGTSPTASEMRSRAA
jgi:hypothetical protein